MAFWIGLGLGTLIGVLLAVIAITVFCLISRASMEPEIYEPGPDGYYPNSLSDPRD